MIYLLTDRSVSKQDDFALGCIISRVQQTEADREGRRKHITEAALREFARNGYHSTDVATIAERAGVSKGTIYNYFDNKEDLLLGVIHDGFRRIDERMQEILSSPGDPVKKLRESLQAYLTFFESQEEFSEVLLKEAVHIFPKVRDEYCGYLVENVGYIETLIKEGIAQKKFDRIDARLAALCLMELVHAATKDSVLIKRKINVREDHRTIMKIFLNGIEKK